MEALPSELRTRLEQFFADVDTNFDLEAKGEELKILQAHEFDLRSDKLRLMTLDKFARLLPPNVHRKLATREETNFGLSELALPSGSAPDPMPAFRWAKVKDQLVRATSVAQIEEVIEAAHRRCLFFGASHLREALIVLGRPEFRAAVWRLVAPLIPEKEEFGVIMQIVSKEESRMLRRLYKPPHY